jgi:hypothetical protein
MQRLRIKKVFPPMPASRIMRLLNLLDGTRTLDEVAAVIREHDASLDVYGVVSVLVDAGYIEGAALSSSTFGQLQVGNSSILLGGESVRAASCL